MQRRSVLWVVLLMGWVGSQPLRAEPDFSKGLLDRKAALEAAAAVTTNEYPDAEEVLIDGMQRMNYNADGTFTEWSEEFIKVLTEAGRRRHLTVSSRYTIPYQRGPQDCRIPLIEIAKPDGRVLPIDVDKQSKTMINGGSMGENIYNPNDKVIQVNITGLEVGDVLHVVTFDRIVQPRMKDTWSDMFGLEDPLPILSYRIEIHAPRERPLRSILLKDEVPGTVRAERGEEDGRLVYRWTVRHVPRMFEEPNMPPLHSVVQRLLVSTMPDWQTVSRWYFNLSEPHGQPTPAMKAEVEGLVRGLSDPREKMQAIFRFVSQQVRYMGITTESVSPGYEPHDVKDTFEARAGVCRDKAMLLAVMLRLAGFDAYPALIDTGARKDAEVPLPYFDHAIVAVRMPDGSYQLMDATNETTGEFLPAYLANKSYLVATLAGDPLRSSPFASAENNLMKIATTGQLGAAGSLTAETVLRFEGINDVAYRGLFARSKVEDRRRFIEGLMKSAVPGARVTGIDIKPEDFMNVSWDLEVRVQFEVGDLLVRGQSLDMIPLPMLGTHLGIANRIIGFTGLTVRRYPFFTEVTCGVQERLALTLPETLGPPLAMPQAASVDTNTVLWQCGVQQSGRLLKAEADFQMKVPEFSPAEYQTLKQTLKTIEQDLRSMPMYKASVEAEAGVGLHADAVVLDEHADIRLTDAHNWVERRTVRKKLLTYSGRKDNAELKIAYTPAWEEVSLVRAVVTAPDGATQAISTQAVNLMDAPWVGTAARYPAEKILVASLPAVSVGSTIDYEFTRTCRQHPCFALRESFRSFDAILSKRLRIEAPAGLELRVAPLQPHGVAVEATSGRVAGGEHFYEWSVRDMPPVKREEMLPPWWTFNPTVMASSGDWRDYARTVARALEKADSRQPQCVQERVGIAEMVADPWERLAAIRDLVALRIREAGPALNEVPLEAVTPADRTLQDGYGNSTDRAVALRALLAAAGFKADYVLVARQPLIAALAGEVGLAADPHLFGEVLVRVRDRRLNLPDGTAVYFNDTDQYDAVGASTHGGQCGVALPSGLIEEVRPAREDKTRIEYELTVSPNGDTELQKTVRLFGTPYGEEKKRFAEMTPEERRRHFQEMIATVSQAAEARGDLAVNFTGYPGIIEYTAWIPGFAVREANYLNLAFPEFLEDFLPLRSDVRVNPLYLTAETVKEVQIVIHRPAAFNLEYWPPFLQARNRGAAGLDAGEQVTVRRGTPGGVMVVDGSMRLKPALVRPDRYAELLDLSQALSHRRARTVLFKTAGVSGELLTKPE